MFVSIFTVAPAGVVLFYINAKAIKNIEVIDRPDASLDSKYNSQIIITTKTIEGIDASV
jgi:hypothetical protein